VLAADAHLCRFRSSRGRQIKRLAHVNAVDDGTLSCSAAEMRFAQAAGGVVSISVIDDVGLPPQRQQPQLIRFSLDRVVVDRS